MQNNDLWPGILAAVAFLLMLYLLGLGWFWVAALLALAVYLGVRFLQPAATARQKAVAIEKPIEPSERIQAVRTLRNRVPTAELQNLLTTVCDRAEVLVAGAVKVPERRLEIEVAVAQYMDVLFQALAQYTQTLRPETASQSRALMEDLLHKVWERLTNLHETILQEDDNQTASVLSSLKQTMQDVDDVLLQVNRLGGGSGR